jgi:hypothetical protein
LEYPGTGFIEFLSPTPGRATLHVEASSAIPAPNDTHLLQVSSPTRGTGKCDLPEYKYYFLLLFLKNVISNNILFSWRCQDPTLPKSLKISLIFHLLVVSSYIYSTKYHVFLISSLDSSSKRIFSRLLYN